jgi:pilus assembly protein CpaD
MEFAMIRTRFTILIAALALAGCATGDRGLVSPHQPVVSAAGAVVRHCPDWRPAPMGEQEGQSSNYGCAAALNLAAMIADPADLIHGKTETASLAETATRAIKSFRETAPSGKGGTVEKVSTKAAAQ